MLCSIGILKYSRKFLEIEMSRFVAGGLRISAHKISQQSESAECLYGFEYMDINPELICGLDVLIYNTIKQDLG